MEVCVRAAFLRAFPADASPGNRAAVGGKIRAVIGPRFP